MKNSSIADFVASSMDNVLKSDSHKKLFGGTFMKKASDESMTEKDESCADDSSGSTDESAADDSTGSDENDAKDTDAEDCSMADDSDEALGVSAAFDIALDSLLTASAALDSEGVGMVKNSELVLRVAALVVEAKKKVKEEKKKGKMDMKALRALKDKKKGGKPTSSSGKSGSGKSGSGASKKK